MVICTVLAFSSNSYFLSITTRFLQASFSVIAYHMIGWTLYTSGVGRNNLAREA